MGEGVSLVREADAGDLHVRFDERRLETERVTRTEVPAMPVNSYSPASRRYRASRRLYTSIRPVGELQFPHHRLKARLIAHGIDETVLHRAASASKRCRSSEPVQEQPGGDALPGENVLDPRTQLHSEASLLHSEIWNSAPHHSAQFQELSLAVYELEELGRLGARRLICPAKDMFTKRVEGDRAIEPKTTAALNDARAACPTVLRIVQSDITQQGLAALSGGLMRMARPPYQRGPHDNSMTDSFFF